jgi:ABC-type amino acid transport substrate-binding protein
MNKSSILIKLLFIVVASVIIHGQAFADLAEIKERGELRHLGVRYANFVTGAGDGFDVELVQGFARHLGVEYKLVYSNFYNVIRDLLGQDVVRKDGQVGLTGEYPVKGDMIAAGFTVLPWRQAVLNYSTPTFPSQVLLVAPAQSTTLPIKGSENLDQDIAETKDLIGAQRLLVMEKTCLDPANYGLKDRGINLQSYTKSTNINEMAPTLLAGEADYTLLDVPDVILDLQKWAGKIKVIGPISGHQNLAAAVPKESPELQAEFNRYLEQVRANGEYDRLLQKYYPGIQNWFPEFFASHLN